MYQWSLHSHNQMAGLRDLRLLMILVRFEGVSWNEDETRIAYVAEEPIPERPVYGRRPSASGSSSEEAQTPTEKKAAGNDAGMWKGRSAWVEDWGEKYTGKQRPLVYVVYIAR